MDRINPFVKFDVEYLKETIPVEAVIREYAGIDVQEGSRKNIRCPFPDRDSVHKNGDKNASASINHNGGKSYCYCHACGEGADSVTLFKKYNPNMHFVDLLYKMADEFGVPLEACSDISQRQEAKKERKPFFSESFPLSYKEVEELGFAVTEKTTDEAPKHDVTAYCDEAHRHIGETSYHRGLSQKTLEHFNVGFVKNWQNPTYEKDAGNGYDRMIIPTSDHSYLARLAISLPDKDFEKDIKCRKVGNVKIFNQEVLNTATEPIFIAEGEIDAMSFYDVGCTAIGLGGTGSVERLLEVLAENKPSQMLVISADNDTAGAKSRAKLMEGLDKLGIEYIVPPNLYPDSKDANEALNKHREEFARKATETKVYAMRIKSKERLIPEGVKEAMDKTELVPQKQASGTVSVQKMWREGGKDDKIAVEDALVERIDELLAQQRELHEQCRASYLETKAKYSPEEWKQNQTLLEAYSKFVEEHPMQNLRRTENQVQKINDAITLNWTEKLGRVAGEKVQQLTQMREKVTSQQEARERFYKELANGKKKEWGKG